MRDIILSNQEREYRNAKASGGLKTFDSLEKKVKLNRQTHAQNEKVYCKTRNATKISGGYRSYIFEDGRKLKHTDV